MSRDELLAEIAATRVALEGDGMSTEDVAKLAAQLGIEGADKMSREELEVRRGPESAFLRVGGGRGVLL